MILPLGSVSPDIFYPFPSLYGPGRRTRKIKPTPAPEKAVESDTIHLSVAARRNLDQAERLATINMLTRE